MDRFEYIENYFTRPAVPEEQSQFEKRLLSDNEFAEDVAFYLEVIQVARNRNQAEKKKRFREIYFENQLMQPVSPVRRLSPYFAAAAAVLTVLIFGVYLYMQPKGPAKLADEYIGEHLKTMSVEMGGNASIIQTGRNLFNNKNYSGSLQKFEEVIQKDTSDYEARELAGIVSLQMQEFDKALLYFKQVAANADSKVNPGKFYQALVLMKRNLPGDKEQARLLLQEVINNGLFGKDDAVEFLRKL